MGKRQKISLAVSILIALIVIALCFAAMFVNGATEGMGAWGRIKGGLPIFFVGIFAVAGLIMIADAIITIVYRKKHCTYVTEATCVELDRRVTTDVDNHSSVGYAPVYEFDYNGRPVKVKGNTYSSSFLNPTPGAVEILHLDEEFKDFYVGDPTCGVKTRIFTGLCFSVPSMGILIYAFLCLIGVIS